MIRSIKFDVKHRSVKFALSNHKRIRVTKKFKAFGYQRGVGQIYNTVCALSGYLQGDAPESMSYGELSFAEDAFINDVKTNKSDDAKFHFIDCLAHFQDWEALD